jgi:hypothetical protein
MVPQLVVSKVVLLVGYSGARSVAMTVEMKEILLVDKLDSNLDVYSEGMRSLQTQQYLELMLGENWVGGRGLMLVELMGAS